MTYDIRFKGRILESGFASRKEAFNRAKELRSQLPPDDVLPNNKCYVWRSDERITDSVSFTKGKLVGSHYAT